MRLRGSLLGATLIVAAAPFGIAQTSAPAAVDPTPTIRTATSEVLLEVTVRDKRGKLVRNLKPADVEILEDGIPQRVVSFNPVVGKAAVTHKHDEGVSSKSTQTPVRSLRTVNLVAIVFHNLDPQARLRAIEAAKEFLSIELAPETYVGLFFLDDRLKPIAAFTNDRAQLLQALQDPFNGVTLDFDKASVAALTANPNEFTVTALVTMAGRASGASVNARLTGGEVARSGIIGADVNTGIGANALRGDRVREAVDFHNISGMRETDKIETMINQFGSLPGRKTVLLTSTGLYTTGDPDLFDNLLAKAAKAGITVYSLDISDSAMITQAQAGNVALGRVASVSRTQSQIAQPGQVGGAGVARNQSRQGDALEQGVRSSDLQAPLRALAEGTGGFLIGNTNEYRKPFLKIVEELDTHYEISYKPVSPKLDGTLRNLQVRLARKDYTADSRTGYFAIPDFSSLPARDVVGLALLSAQPPPRAFDFRTAAYRFHSTGALAPASLAFEVPGTSLSTIPDPARQVEKVHFTLFALIKDSNGEIVDTYSLDAPFDIAALNMANVRSSSVSYTHPITLPPGQYTVQTAVLDQLNGRASTGVSRFDILAPAPQLAISDVVMVQRVESVTGAPDPSDPLVYQGKRVVPLVSQALPPKLQPYAYFVVYPKKGDSAKPRIRVDFLVDGKVRGSQSAELPPPDAAGPIPMMVGVATRPGECELRITAMQGDAAAAEILKYSVQ